MHTASAALCEGAAGNTAAGQMGKLGASSAAIQKADSSRQCSNTEGTQ